MLWPRLSKASDPSDCEQRLGRSNVVACVLATSPTFAEELALQRASDGRKEAARPILPSNPVVTGSVGSRQGTTDQAVNWSVALGQELEVGGQRGLRLEAAEHDLQAQTLRVAAIRSSIAAEAWKTYFEILAAKKRLNLAMKLEAATEATARTAAAMSASGLTSEVDADIASAAALRSTQDRIKAEQQLAVVQGQMQFLVGNGPVRVNADELVPLKGTSTTAQRPELLSAQKTELALKTKVDLVRRSRIPNPTVSLFAQNDGFNERVLGVGLSIPLPLPQPIGRTSAGEIAEGTALADKAKAESDRVGRELGVELLLAKSEYEANTEIANLYSAERVQRALARLESIAAQVKASRIPVRDALIAQQALVDELKAEIDAREALCLASVRLTRASGASLEGDSL